MMAGVGHSQTDVFFSMPPLSILTFRKALFLLLFFVIFFWLAHLSFIVMSE